MSTILGANGEPIRKSLRANYRGAPPVDEDEGWTDNSYHPVKSLEDAKFLGDEEYHNTLGVHNPLWRYIITRYTKESEAPLLVIGYDAMALAIELSQWTYPINMVVRNNDEKKHAEYDTKRQAGFFKKLIVSNYMKGEGGYPASRIAIFIGIIDRMDNEYAKKFVDFLLKGVNEVVCAVKPNRNWRDVFGKNLADVVGYNKGNWLLLRIN